MAQLGGSAPHPPPAKRSPVIRAGPLGGSVRARRAAREPRAYAGADLRDDEWLPDVIGHPRTERVDHVLMPGPRRDHDHRGGAVTLVGAEPPTDLDAVTARSPPDAAARSAPAARSRSMPASSRFGSWWKSTSERTSAARARSTAYSTVLWPHPRFAG